RSSRILRESRGMITIDVVTDAVEGERVQKLCEDWIICPYGRGIDIVSPRQPTRGLTGKSVVEPVDIHARHDHHRQSGPHPGAATKLLRDIDGGVADTILIAVLHRRYEDRAGTMAHRDHRDRPSGGLRTVGGLAERHVIRSAARDARQLSHHLVI